MQTNQFTIGQKVKYNTSGKSNYMRNGIITGFDLSNNRVFINWPNHGSSSIHINNIVLEQPLIVTNNL